MFSYQYPRPALTADIVLMNPSYTEVLLIKRGRDPFKDCWAFPGGFFDMDDEDIAHTASRELQEETGLTDIALRQVLVASQPGRDPRGRTVSVIFMGCVDPADVKPRGGDDAAEARWFAVDSLPPLAFDHGQILQECLHETIK